MNDDAPNRGRKISRAKTLLGAVVRTCAEDEGGLEVLADRLGVDPNTVRKVITNEGTPTTATLAIIARYLELPLDTVWEWHAVRECC